MPLAYGCHEDTIAPSMNDAPACTPREGFTEAVRIDTQLAGRSRTSNRAREADRGQDLDQRLAFAELGNRIASACRSNGAARYFRLKTAWRRSGPPFAQLTSREGAGCADGKV
jgi:hypothetical protein